VTWNERRRARASEYGGESWRRRDGCGESDREVHGKRWLSTWLLAAVWLDGWSGDNMGWGGTASLVQRADLIALWCEAVGSDEIGNLVWVSVNMVVLGRVVSWRWFWWNGDCRGVGSALDLWWRRCGWVLFGGGLSREVVDWEGGHGDMV
jgi:hypothetical protein